MATDRTEMRCCAPLWWGDGTPAGHCREPAYGPEAHMRDNDDYWKSAELARCPAHGGPTVDEFADWIKWKLYG